VAVDRGDDRSASHGVHESHCDGHAHGEGHRCAEPVCYWVECCHGYWDQDRQDAEPDREIQPFSRMPEAIRTCRRASSPTAPITAPAATSTSGERHTIVVRS
jgi:hypothetical protein